MLSDSIFVKDDTNRYSLHRISKSEWRLSDAKIICIADEQKYLRQFIMTTFAFSIFWE